MEGRVPSYRMKKLAGPVATRLLRTPHVVNRLRVVPQSQRRDTVLAAAALAALAPCLQAAEQTIDISTRHGIVILHGSVCCSACRSEVEAAIWALGGVVDVTNHLRVSSSPVSHAKTQVSSFLAATHR